MQLKGVDFRAVFVCRHKGVAVRFKFGVLRLGDSAEGSSAGRNV